MIVKISSMLYGYRKLKGEVRMQKGVPVLFVDEIGELSPLEFIKQAADFESITPAERDLLKRGGYRFRA